MDIDDIDDAVPPQQQQSSQPTTTTSTTTTTTTSPKLVKKGGGKKPTKAVDPFEGKDYYQCFGLERDATNEQIIKAYKKLALEYHPDRKVGDKVAAEHFATVSKMHQTLIDPRKRQFYDSHGPSADMSDGFLNAYELWKETCPDLTPDDTTKFRLSYEDTEEEYRDVVAAFIKCKGDLFLMMKNELFFSSPESHERDEKMVRMLIERGDIKNDAMITIFNTTAPTAGTKLAEFIAEEERLHAEMEAKARERALKKSKNGKVTEMQIMIEMRMLMHEHSRRTEGADTLENIALALGGISGAKEEAEAELEAKGLTKAAPKPAATGGRTASKKASASAGDKVRPSDLDSDDDGEDTKPNPNKRKLQEDE